MKKTAAFFIILLLSLSVLCSCSPDELPDCKKVLLSMTDAEIGIPAGKIYLMNADKDDSEYISPLLTEALYGSEKLREITGSWIDYALFLPLGDHPCEFGVFLCNTRAAANDTARLLSSRLSSIKKLKYSDKYKTMLDNAKVCVIGNVALLIISSDAENAFEIAKKSLK